MIPMKIQRHDKVTKLCAKHSRHTTRCILVILMWGRRAGGLLPTSLYWQLPAQLTWGLQWTCQEGILTASRSHSHYNYTNQSQSEAPCASVAVHFVCRRSSSRQTKQTHKALTNVYSYQAHLHLGGRRLATAEERVSARLSHRASCLAPPRLTQTAAVRRTWRGEVRRMGGGEEGREGGTARVLGEGVKDG